MYIFTFSVNCGYRKVKIPSIMWHETGQISMKTYGVVKSWLYTSTFAMMLCPLVSKSAMLHHSISSSSAILMGPVAQEWSLAALEK